MMDKKAIGKRIKQIKESHIPPLTLAEFGAKLRNKDGNLIPKGTVDSWMRGLAYPPHYLVEQIARIGSVTTEWIYTGKNLPKLICMECQEKLIIETNNNLMCPKCCAEYILIKQYLGDRY